MRITTKRIDRTCAESEIYNALLSLDNSDILDLGCGNAEQTRAIASGAQQCRIVALEVDEIQHAKNLRIKDLPNVRFGLGGAQAIPIADNFFDVVFMFKSLHHVPIDLMGQGLEEVWRVLKPGGYAYISEPIFAGDFNEILRLFHDERRVREAAFLAVKAAVDGARFLLVDELFFNSSVHFEDFADFESQVIKVTHSDHHLSEDLYSLVHTRFEQHMGVDGVWFEAPTRVDLLQKPAHEQ